MSYVVLARKYRPPDFGALVGQEHVVQALSNALTQQRLHHAYLFTGTRGVGKTTISRILAKSLNCTGPDGSGGITAAPCGVCQACRDIDIGRFIDYVELDAASNRGVDEISQLLDQAVYKPVVGRFKVYMVDEVHMLSTTAFNAMLKTLEEPPDYLKFVLATTDPQKVPATVLSRCLQFNLRPMPPQTVQAHLADVLRRESIPAEAGALGLLSRAARGSMRDALSLADQAIAYGGGELAEDGVRQMLGAVDRGHAVRMIEALADGDGAGLVAAADALRALGLSASGALEEMAGLLQQMAVLQAVPAAADPTDPGTPEALRLASLLAGDELQLFYSMALHGRAELGLAPDEYSGLVMVLLRMLAFKPPPAGETRPPSTVARVEPTPAADRPAPQTAAPAAVVTPRGVASAQLASAGVSPAGVAPAVVAPAAVTPVALAPPVDTSGLRLAAVAAPTVVTSTIATPPIATRSIPTPPTAEPDVATRAPAMPATPALAAAPAAATGDAAGQAAPRPPRGVAAPVAQAASVAAPPALRLRPVSRPPADEPPPWLDVPDADEEAPAVSRVAREATGPDTGPDTGREAEPAEPIPRSGRPAAVPGKSLAPPPWQATPLGDRWDGLVRRMIEGAVIGAMVRELAMQAQCVALDDAARPVICRLRVEREMLRAPAIVEKLQAALALVLGSDIRLETEPGFAADSPSRRDSAERDRRQGEAEQIIQHDPLVQALMAQYQTARIVPGSIKPN